MKYLVYWDGKNLDLLESFRKRKGFNQNLRNVHQLIKSKNIPVEKEIKEISRDDEKLLGYLEASPE